MPSSTTPKTDRVAGTSMPGYVHEDVFQQFQDRVETGFRTIDTAIGELSKKLDDVRSKGTDWRTIFAAMSVFLGVCSLVGGIIAWGLLDKIERNAKTIERHEELEAHPVALRNLGQNDVRIRDVEAVTSANRIDLTNIRLIVERIDERLNKDRPK